MFDYIMDPNVTVWDVPPGTPTGDLEGHAFTILGYSTSGGLMWKLVSWGQTYLMTPAFVTAYCDEALAGWSPKDWVKTGTAPNGFDKAQLKADLHQIGIFDLERRRLRALARRNRRNRFRRGGRWQLSNVTN